MTWKDITVEQFQKLEQVLRNYQEGEDTTEVDFKTLLICYNLTEEEGNNLTFEQNRDMMKGLAFINNEKMEFTPVRYSVIGDTRYRYIYDIRNVRAHRYIEAKVFESRSVIDNLHRIAASMVNPEKKVLLGWKKEKYDSARHDQYAEDLLKAPITDVYGSVVFFCKVYINSMRSLKDYLKAEMKKTSLKEQQAETAFIHLCKLMDGLSRQLS